MGAVLVVAVNDIFKIGCRNLGAQTDRLLLATFLYRYTFVGFLLVLAFELAMGAPGHVCLASLLAYDVGYLCAEGYGAMKEQPRHCATYYQDIWLTDTKTNKKIFTFC